MVRSFRLWEQSTVHQPQPNRLEGVSYDMVIHEILGDFASQEGAADVIRDIQERSATIPQSIPFAARTFVGVSELPSPCCIKCPVCLTAGPKCIFDYIAWPVGHRDAKNF